MLFIGGPRLAKKIGEARARFLLISVA